MVYLRRYPFLTQIGDTMKARELIEKLQAVDPELEVMTEGCDCFGEPVDVEVITTNEPCALITRKF